VAAPSSSGSLEDRIARGPLAPIYLLVSDEPLLVDRAVAALREAAMPAALRGFNEEMFDGKGLTATRLLNAAQTLPMMAPRRLVLVRDLAAMAAAELAGLLPYLERPSPSTVLVGTASKIDKRIKLWAAAGKAGVLHELTAPRDLSGFVRAEAERRGVAIRPPAASRLAEVVGKDLARLSISLEQLALYADGRPIEVDDVDDLVAETRERSVFELTDAIGAGQRQRALVALESLIDQKQSPVGVVAMLARHVRQLGLVLAARDEGVPRGELPRLVGAPPFVVDKLATQAQRLGPAQVARATAELAWADRALKGEAPMVKTLGRALGERAVLERVVDSLLTLARA
jgi:DNA polymerase III subunit delta